MRSAIFSPATARQKVPETLRCMKTTFHIILFAVVSTSYLLCGCMSQQARTARVERRQDRIDTRTAGRQERQQIRAERQDARSQAAFDSW